MVLVLICVSSYCQLRAHSSLSSDVRYILSSLRLVHRSILSFFNSFVYRVSTERSRISLLSLSFPFVHVLTDGPMKMSCVNTSTLLSSLIAAMPLESGCASFSVHTNIVSPFLSNQLDSESDEVKLKRQWLVDFLLWKRSIRSRLDAYFISIEESG